MVPLPGEAEHADETLQDDARGEHYTDDRTTLAFAYEGDELVARLFKKRAVREFQASSLYDVVLTPDGEEGLSDD